ncbi:MAG: C-GCAxxG-C-C family protein [Candidatus Helarchaeota archaeon]
MVSVEEVKKKFEIKINELKEELPKKYKKETIQPRNCAAWTVASMLELLEIEDINIINMASTLAGITRICGAVAGGLMMIGLIVGESGKKEIPQWTAAAEGMKLIKRFQKNFCSIKCPDLTDYDLLTSEGMKAYIQDDVWGKRCYLHVVKAIELIGKLYKKQIAKLLSEN